MFRVMVRVDRWIREKAATSLNPSQVETSLVQLGERWPPSAPPFVDVVEQFPLGEASLLHLLAVSSICATRLVRNPETLLWLRQPEVCLASRGYAEMLNELRSVAGDSIAAENFAALRVWKGREMTRIALRELANLAPLEETTAELSQIADICIRRVCEHWDAEFRKRYGSPDAEFAILALGKLGGAELNHSSDVDLLFLYSEEGQLTPQFSYHEFFNRLGKKILETFSTRHPEGSLFRVDLRLRPEGSAGPLARSLESMENYYAGFGETWERLALIKARGIAGSRELAYEFLRQHQPFIYPKSPTPDLLDEIANIKRRIERDVVGPDKLERDVKLGRGGIREIEFIVQALQLIHGAHHPFLQEASMLRALRALRELDLLPRGEVLTLDKHIGFSAVSSIDCRSRQSSKHTLFRKNRKLCSGWHLACAFRPSKISLRRCKKGCALSARFFNGLSPKGPWNFQPKSASKFSMIKNTPPKPSRIWRKAREASTSRRAHVKYFGKLRPVLLEWLAKAADPNATLNQFVRFVEAYGLRSLLFELLVTNPKLLELLVKTFDASRFAGDLLIRHPQLLEEITRDPAFYKPRSIDENLRRLDSLGANAGNLDPVRAYRRRQLLRIVLRDALGLTNPVAVFNELSDLAEACLLFTTRLLGGEQMTIIALGKFGGREISYGADLDVLFVGDDVRSAQNLVVAMAQPTAEGNIWVLDARLRPEGEKGPLVCSLETYQSYYAGRAQPWELQALTRARAVTGPLQSEFIEMAKHVWRDAGQHVDLRARIDNMLERIRRDRGSGSDFLDFKTGFGGIIEAEFLVQALQMRENIWEPNWERAVDLLRGRGRLIESEIGKLETLTHSCGAVKLCCDATTTKASQYFQAI